MDTPARSLNPGSGSQRGARHSSRSGARVPQPSRDYGPLIVAAVAIVACIAGLMNEFAHDDLHLVVANERVHSVAIREQFTSPFWPAPFSQDLYRPLMTFLLSLQYAVGGEDSLIFRLVSYALYAGCAVLTFHLARRVVSRRAALVGAMIFAAHPVHVEAVALAAAQNELLVALLAVVMTARYLDARRRGQLTVAEWLVVCALCLAAALLKETGLVLPALLVAVELLLAPSETRRPSRLAAGFAALAAIAVAAVMARARVLGDVAGTFTAEALIGLDGWARALTMLSVVPQWFRLLVWPAHLRLDYSPQEFSASSGFGRSELLGAMLLLGVIWLAVAVRRRAPLVTFGIVWCAIALLPVSNVLIPTGVLIAERTLFLPSVGFALALAGASEPILARGRATRRALAVAGTIIVLLGVGRSIERQRVWRNDALISVRTVQDAPRSFRAQRAYADVLFALQRPELALETYDLAIDLAPAPVKWRVRNDLARQLRARGDHGAEAVQLEASLSQQPSQLDGRGYLIAAYLTTGQYEKAAAQADSAIAHGGVPSVFSRLRQLADSAREAQAPPGSIRIAINTATTNGQVP